MKNNEIASLVEKITDIKQLEILSKALGEKREQLKLESLEANLNVDDLKTAKEIWNEYLNLCDTHKFQTNLNVEISLKVKSDFLNFNDFLNNLDDFDIVQELPYFESKAKLSSEDENLSKKQLKILQHALNNVVDNACDEISIFLPENVFESLKTLHKKIIALKTKLNKHNLTISDLTNLC